MSVDQVDTIVFKRILVPDFRRGDNDYENQEEVDN
jgi:hypothetical protein